MDLTTYVNQLSVTGQTLGKCHFKKKKGLFLWGLGCLRSFSRCGKSMGFWICGQKYWWASKRVGSAGLRIRPIWMNEAVGLVVRKDAWRDYTASQLVSHLSEQPAIIMAASVVSFGCLWAVSSGRHKTFCGTVLVNTSVDNLEKLKDTERSAEQMTQVRRLTSAPRDTI